MAKLVYDDTGRLLFTKEMKEEYTILMPQMLPVHFGMFQRLLELEGYKVDMLTTNHRGIDIGGVYYSSTVYAAKAGTVIISSSNSVRGQYIVISHGSGNTTTYQHLSKRSVSVGAVVKQGQAIGVTGSSGVGSGPHLHFEITENGQLVNPLKYLTDYVKAWN